MKVCTDSCLFGAIIPINDAATILDIGTGTGLLALMAAQRSKASIQAVELDKAAARQAADNFAQSPWADRISLFTGSIQDYEKMNTQVYDVIISNPPFYIDSQQSPDSARNRAMHSTDLPFEDLARFIQKFLAITGSAFILLPPKEATIFTQLALKFNLFLHQEHYIFTQENGKHIRTILHFKKSSITEYKPPEAIYIRNTSNQYSDEFRTLLEPFYLIF